MAEQNTPEPDGKPRCRKCRNVVRVREDETAMSHQHKGRRCDGSYEPLLGEAPCSTPCYEQALGTVSWPAKRRPAPEASTLVCHYPPHQQEAARWVEKETGHLGVLVTHAEWRRAYAEGRDPEPRPIEGLA